MNLGTLIKVVSLPNGKVTNMLNACPVLVLVLIILHDRKCLSLQISSEVSLRRDFFPSGLSYQFLTTSFQLALQISDVQFLKNSNVYLFIFLYLYYYFFNL